MTTEQAFQNLVAIVFRAQKGGLLELHEAVAVDESLKLVNKALGLQGPQAVSPVAEEQAAQ